MTTKKIQLSEKAYLAIKQNITSGQLKQGDAIVEHEIAEQLSISRTPIREALNKLSAEGYVETIPNRGCFVKKITPREFLDIMQIREALEGMAARLACERVTRKELDEVSAQFPLFDGGLKEVDYLKAYEAGENLHKFLVEKSGNLLLEQQLSSLRKKIDRTVQIAADVPGRYEKAYIEHKHILDALYERNPDLAEKKMRFHINQVRTTLLFEMLQI
jgi:DNA-binding GntR family transcriptional regulator